MIEVHWNTFKNKERQYDQELLSLIGLASEFFPVTIIVPHDKVKEEVEIILEKASITCAGITTRPPQALILDATAVGYSRAGALADLYQLLAKEMNNDSE